MQRRSFLQVIAAAVGSLFVGFKVEAKARQPKTCEFVPGEDPNNWHDPRNWVGGVMPKNGDSVLVRAARFDLGIIPENTTLDTLSIMGAMDNSRAPLFSISTGYK